MSLHGYLTYGPTYIRNTFDYHVELTFETMTRIKSIYLSSLHNYASLMKRHFKQTGIFQVTCSLESSKNNNGYIISLPKEMVWRLKTGVYYKTSFQHPLSNRDIYLTSGLQIEYRKRGEWGEKMRGSGEGEGGSGDEYRYMFGAKTWKDTIYGSKISENWK